MSSLRKAVEDYLILRRALGFKLRDMATALRHFVSFMEREGARTITTNLALRWAMQPQQVHPAHWVARLSFVRSFARHWSAIDPQTEIPPQGLLPYRYHRCTPHFYTDDQIRRLIKTAWNLPPTTGLRRWTYSTLFGLLAVTGLRISEAIALQQDDVDLNQGLLTIRLAKFRKSRLVPLHPSTTHRLKRYASKRETFYPKDISSHFFLSAQGRPLTDSMVRWTFVRLSRQIGLRGLSDHFGPRLHDFRHRFAVTTLLQWYRSGLDVEQRLPFLSTFLGHTHVTDT
jgi:integrase/recombinase XerD